MAITDLTNTKWLFNEHIDIEEDNSFNIIFSSNNSNFTQLSTTWYVEEGADFVSLNYNATEVYGGMSYIAEWDNNAYKTIEITGGTDTSSASLISWLETNATQITATTTKDITTINDYDSLAAGAHTIQIAATDSTGTRDDSTKTSYSFTKLVAPTRISGSTLLNDNFEFGTVNNSNGYKVYADNILLGVVQPITLSISPAGAATINKNYADVTSSTSDTVTLTPASGYLLPSSVTVTGATSSYNSTTGVVTLTSISGAITITATAIVESHTLTNSITNMSVSGTTIFDDGGSGTTNVSCGSAYGLPLTISVNGTAVAAGATVSSTNFTVTYTMTNDRAGTLAFSNVKADLTLTGTVRETLNAPTIAFAEEEPSGFSVTFAKAGSTTHSTMDTYRQYSLDGTTWNNITLAMDGASLQNVTSIYFRVKGNGDNTGTISWTNPTGNLIPENYTGTWKTSGEIVLTGNMTVTFGNTINPE